MKISELIEQLQEMEVMCGPDQVVRAYCPEGEAYFPVTGFVYGGGDGIVDLYTDED
jgi:hypothetical protein